MVLIIGWFPEAKVRIIVCQDFLQFLFSQFSLDQVKEPQTAMYLLDDTLAWSTWTDMVLPEPMIAHCTVQINENTIAFIGGTSSVAQISKETRTQIFVLTGEEWSYGPDLPVDVERGGNMGCYRVPDDENIVIFGCAQGGSSQKVYEWNISGNSTRALYDCPSNGNIKGLDFHVMDDNSTVLTIGLHRNIYTFDPDTGFSSRYGRLTENHNPGTSMLVPRKNAYCNE